ncbi:MAG: c-type cytochrome [Proteobacteria bacterium]|uniref:c-type cytochrome n=1 Tax=Rudaea sp. TaxID=2136325 RepID=UPI003220886A|nr:c-type cytochrome [Pseudomonadota bacterium]
MKALRIAAIIAIPFVLAALAIGFFLFERQGGFAPYRVPDDNGRSVASDTATLQRGEYLARIGDCAACHTAPGGAAYAGGRGFATGWGMIYSSNLSSDAQHGIGAWSRAEFAHAMRHGVSRRGPLYPVFPYEHFATLADADIDAIFAWLRRVPANANVPPPNRLDFPASRRSALVLWRMLYYRPEAQAPAAASEDRGRYLVDGLGHCAMCHSTREAGGALAVDGYLAGGRIPGSGWYAPPLDAKQLQRYSVEQLATYLRSGASDHGAAYGPMAEVVYRSLQALTGDDALAMARYLKSVPARPRRDAPFTLLPEPAQRSIAASGAEVYKRNCADCHGKDGEGKSGEYPALRDAVATTAPDPINAVRMVLYGGFPAATAGNPLPHSMPPFVQQLGPAEIAAVTNYVRENFGGQRSYLTAADVEAMHGIVLD